MKNLQELLAQEMDTAWEQQKQAADCYDNMVLFSEAS